ncbi:transposase [Ralstonia solanacearum]|uniref:transposase n=1 Tax=Ralstonia solanacearum TaxID=305 RepID=UPI003D68A8F3
MSRILATAARLCPPLTIRTASSLNSNVYRALGLPISVPPCSSLNPQQGRHSSGATSNYGTHKTPSIKSWFARRPRFHVHFTPTSASWLNQVERWFATLTEKYIRRGTHRSTRQLEEAIRHYLDVYNANPRPFVWSKSADEILASLERFCARVQRVSE